LRNTFSKADLDWKVIIKCADVVHGVLLVELVWV